MVSICCCLWDLKQQVFCLLSSCRGHSLSSFLCFGQIYRGTCGCWCRLLTHTRQDWLWWEGVGGLGVEPRARASCRSRERVKWTARPRQESPDIWCNSLCLWMATWIMLSWECLSFFCLRTAHLNRNRLFDWHLKWPSTVYLVLIVGWSNVNAIVLIISSFLKDPFYAHQCCIYLSIDTVWTLIVWNICTIENNSCLFEYIVNYKVYKK